MLFEVSTDFSTVLKMMEENDRIVEFKVISNVSKSQQITEIMVVENSLQIPD